MLKSPVWCPILISLYPLLYVYVSYIEVVSFGELASLTSVAVGLSSLLYAGLRFIFKNKFKASFFSSLIIFIFFSYGYLFDFLRLTPVNDIIQGRHTLGFIIFIFLLIILFALLFKSKRNFKSLFFISITFSIFLLIFQLIRLGLFLTNSISANFQQNEKYIQNSKNLVVNQRLDNLPDIYYLIFDRYGRDDTFRDIYGFDNSDFISFLEASGFYVASKSWANYASTDLSLGSSLNMNYIQDLFTEIPKNSNDLTPVHFMIKNNLVLANLKKLGYSYIHGGSWWGATSINSQADLNINYWSIPEFTEVIIAKSMLFPLIIKFELPVLNSRYTQFLRVNYKFDELVKISERKGGKFVFSHFLIPHKPYVFDKDGNFISDEESVRRSKKQNYTEQVIYLNKKIKKLIEAILNNSGKTKPIIIIQADEGPYPEVYSQDHITIDWAKATDSEIKQKMRILSAYYLPENIRGNLYSSITPVNTFRYIFKYYFDVSIDLLPDKSYLSNQGTPYKLIEIDRTKEDLRRNSQ